MSGVVACDVSEFNSQVDDSYPHRWLIFRACDGDHVDTHAAHNLAWAKAAKAAGKIDGYTAYVVYRPGMNAVLVSTLDTLGFPSDEFVEIDAESWGGQITGDHSVELDQLAEQLRSRQGGDPDRVWGYGNRNDLATIWVSRPSWLRLDRASYGGSQPTDGDLIGWQYTDGQYTVSGLPSSTSPFGACDHNLLFLNLLSKTAPVKDDEDMPVLYTDEARKGAPILVTGAWSIPVQDPDTVAAHKRAGFPVVTLGAHDYNRARRAMGA